MSIEEILREALARLVSMHEDRSVFPSTEFALAVEAHSEWAKDQLAALDAAPAEQPSAPDASSEWRALMNRVSDVWQDALARCSSDEERARAHKYFAAIVNALCALATVPALDLSIGGDT